jgi:NTP pyrophosphatase (non-canonical NTP hydrolase)
VTHNFPNSDSVEQLLGVVEEVGELAHAVLKFRQGIRGTSEEHRAETIDAVGDILIYLINFCNYEKIDIAACLAETWDTVRFRDWRAYPKTGK